MSRPQDHPSLRGGALASFEAALRRRFRRWECRLRDRFAPPRRPALPAAPERLVFAWRQASFPPELTTEVEVRFEDKGGETRVSVEHRGFDRVPAGNAARHGFPDQVLLMRLAERWRELLTAMERRT